MSFNHYLSFLSFSFPFSLISIYFRAFLVVVLCLLRDSDFVLSYVLDIRFLHIPKIESKQNNDNYSLFLFQTAWETKNATNGTPISKYYTTWKKHQAQRIKQQKPKQPEQKLPNGVNKSKAEELESEDGEEEEVKMEEQIAESSSASEMEDDFGEITEESTDDSEVSCQMMYYLFIRLKGRGRGNRDSKTDREGGREVQRKSKYRFLSKYMADYKCISDSAKLKTVSVEISL